MAITLSAPQNIGSPNGNSLALYKDASTGKYFVKDINGQIEEFSANILSDTLQEVLSQGNTTGGNDLIFSDGDSLKIATASGDDFFIKSSLTDEILVGLRPDNGVMLYYNNDKKCETTSYGFRVGGDLRVTGLLDLFQTNDNTFAGTNAGNLDNQVGNTNTGFGENSQSLQLSGSNNSSLGFNSLKASATGNNNTAIGTNSLPLSDGGSNNTAVGNDSLSLATSGSGNTAIGNEALKSKLTSNFNTAVGNESLNAVTTGFRNTAIGNEAGRLTTTGSYNTSIGDEATPTTLSASNEVTLGGASVLVLRCAVTSITSLSDERDKTDISELEYGLDFVNSLSAKKWTWNQRSEYRDEIDEDGNKVQVEIENSNRGKIDFGFIAQEVQSVDNELLRLVYDSNPEKLEMSYGKLVPILVKAIQELSNKINKK
jgi:hypothetical protein